MITCAKQGQTHTLIKQFHIETIQATVVKKAKFPAIMTNLSHSLEGQDLQLFANQTTPKRNHSHQSQKPKKQVNKSYTFQFSIINILVVCCFILMIIVFYHDFSSKKGKLLSRIKFQIKHCNSSYSTNRCNSNQSHMKVKHMFQKCLEWNECKSWNPQQQLAIRVSISGILGQTISDFFNGLGIFYVCLLILLIFSVGYLAKAKQKFSIQIKSS